MSTVRTVEIWESALDLQALFNNGFNLNVAKSVIDSSGQPKYNMVWKSLTLAPRMKIQWKVEYCLNWTLEVPFRGTEVVVGGVWQDCAKGEAYDINRYGMWEASSVPAKPDFMTVGKNNYSYDGTTGINIVIGVKTPDGNVSPIFVDTTPLGLGMSSWYQPQEKAQWWYERNTRAATMTSGTQTNVQTWDLSSPRSSDGQYFVSSTFIYAAGTWNTNTDNPPRMALSSGSNLSGLIDLRRGINFDPTMLSSDGNDLIGNDEEPDAIKANALVTNGVPA